MFERNSLEEQKNFIADFASGAHGINEQCGKEKWLEAKLTCERVLYGVFGTSQDTSLDLLIRQELSSFIYKSAVDQHVKSPQAKLEENRRSFSNRLKEASSAPPCSPEVFAHQILTTLRTEHLKQPQKWRASIEKQFSPKAFITHSKGAITKTLANECKDPFYLTTRSILFHMKKMGMIKKKPNSKDVPNDRDCLELLALKKQLPKKFDWDPQTIDQSTLEGTINKYFNPSKSISKALQEISQTGDATLITLFQEIFKDTKKMERLDKAVAKFHNQKKIKQPPKESSIRVIASFYSNEESSSDSESESRSNSGCLVM